MKKRAFTTITALGLTAVMLAGCGSSSSGDTAKTDSAAEETTDSSAEMTDEERVLALIDLDALEYNIKSIRKKTPDMKSRLFSQNSDSQRIISLRTSQWTALMMIR